MNTPNQPYSIVIDDQSFEIHPNDLGDLSLYQASPKELTVLLDEKNYQVEVLDVNYSQKQIRLKINHQIMELSIKDSFDQLVERLGISANSQQKINSINAPMPGLVLDVLVEEGQTIEGGENLVILEAMKMENIIKAPGSGTISNIEVEKGQAVEKGTTLIRLD